MAMSLHKAAAVVRSRRSAVRGSRNIEKYLDSLLRTFYSSTYSSFVSRSCEHKHWILSVFEQGHFFVIIFLDGVLIFRN